MPGLARKLGQRFAQAGDFQAGASFAFVTQAHRSLPRRVSASGDKSYVQPNQMSRGKGHIISLSLTILASPRPAWRARLLESQCEIGVAQGL
jgi:hypothetical protein